MDSVEKQVTALEEEMKAIKTTFAMASTSLSVYVANLTFTTTPDQVTITGPDAATYWGEERVVLTFDTIGGVNAIAALEFSGSYNSGVIYRPPVVRRVPYTGGARWVIETWPSGDGTGVTFNFTVCSSAEGTLTAEMIWQ